MLSDDEDDDEIHGEYGDNSDDFYAYSERHKKFKQLSLIHC